MKTKAILAVLWACLVFVACDDTISRIGLGIQPEEDKISVYDTIVYITATTIKTDSVYAKTINGYLGEYYDPFYGSIKSGFASQFYPGYEFYPDSMTTGKIDSVRLILSYKDFAGDPQAPMEVSVYPIVNPLKKHYYTSLDPADFCDMSKPLAVQSYMAHNPFVSDSLLATGNYFRVVSISLPPEFGDKFVAEYKKPEPNAFSSIDAFVDFFPGLYLQNSFGKGSMIAVDRTRLVMFYQRNHVTTTSDGEADSTIVVTDYADFQVTKEVVQINSMETNNNDHLLQPNDEVTYIKSPMGVFTKISIPIRKIKEGIGTRKFSGVKLSLKANQKEGGDFMLDFPGMGEVYGMTHSHKLLLIEPDSVKNFFETQRVADNYTSYATTFNPSTYSYTYNNISNLIQNTIDKSPEKETLDLLLIPIRTDFSLQTISYQQIAIDYSTSYLLAPTAVTLKKDPENMKIRILASDLEK